MTRREVLAALAAPAFASSAAPRSVAITIDDVAWQAIPAPWSDTANHRLLATLAQHHIKAALLPAGTNVDNQTGRAILQSWNDAGHLIGNHTWSHRVCTGVDTSWFEQDMLRCDALVSQWPRFRRFFRFPALKEGHTARKRDDLRAFLAAHRYRNAHVTIDASDWYYDRRLRLRLEREPGFDPLRYRQPYLDHISDRATYYEDLGRRVLGRSIPHTILLHYNLINTLFLADVLEMFVQRGWTLIGAEQAWADPVFQRQPKIVPAGESLVWALAKETGRFDAILRYPGEDDTYEKPILDRLGL